MKALSWLATLVLSALPCIYAASNTLSRIPELKGTGLSETQLRSLLDPRAVNVSCAVNHTTDGVVFPGPTVASVKDLLKGAHM